jgi:hypothetical protein
LRRVSWYRAIRFLVQYFPLYILPVIMIVLGYFFFSLLGFCKKWPGTPGTFYSQAARGLP